MAFNVFQDKRNQESVAYDLALALAAKDPAITSPEALIKRVSELLPDCRSAAEAQYNSERPEPFDIPIKW
ncbi:hypothetical protein DAI21_17535 [Lelliottia sp. WB101]|uniref:hypothetical protein n=1 Tax=Lelliottia sp. WB101 TaxID=2153385 RepID=UPI000D1FE647|nr:hypothetical protein [Lelliottia sp. WB101]AVY99324.1 hypothetical protein DAI21_17535 [Lelliottia sp. WB101]